MQFHNPRAWETKARGLLQVPGQSGIQSEILPQKRGLPEDQDNTLIKNLLIIKSV